MGSRGPAPKPTYLKILNGNPGKRALNKDEPKPERTAPKCPTWLEEDAKKEWKRIAPKLAKMGLLTTIDMAAFAAYCQAYARWKQAEEALAKHGTVFKTPNGYIQQLPQVALARNYARLMKEFMQQFGMTPSARTAITNRGAGLGGLGGGDDGDGDGDEFDDY